MYVTLKDADQQGSTFTCLMLIHKPMLAIN